MDELEKILSDFGFAPTGVRCLAKLIRDTGYHKDPEKFCYAPMQQQNPPPKRKRIEKLVWAENLGFVVMMNKLNELIDAYNEEG